MSLEELTKEIELTLFSSVADQKAEMLYKKIREQAVAIAQMIPGDGLTP